MNSKKAQEKSNLVDKIIKKINDNQKAEQPSKSLEENMLIIQGLFADVDILRTKTVQSNRYPDLRYGIAFCDGVVDNAIINDNILRPLMISEAAQPGPQLMDILSTQVIQIGEATWTADFSKVIEAICYGDTILFAQGIDKALILNTKGFVTRATTEPENERSLSGPREGFTESIMLNLSFIRRKLRTNDLKMKFLSVGKRSNTSICVCYIGSIANQSVLAEVYRRLGQIDIDAVLDSNYLTELIRDNHWSPFRSTGYTERPDVVVGKLLEGRIAIFIDGTPSVLTVPYLFIENYQSNEDYYLNYYYTTYSRLLRIIGFFLTIGVPGIYISVVAFHHEMLPTALLINIAAEQQSVPLPAALEAFIMLIVFDILRETGIRMPSNVGQALSIVGALVIGQAAVAAKMVAAPMIIVVGITGITNLLVPKLNAPVIYFRFFVLLSSSIFGFFGFVLSASCMMIHIFNLTSMGIPQVTLGGDLKHQQIKDTAIRAPWWQMLQRPPMLTQNLTRLKQKDNDNA